MIKLTDIYKSVLLGEKLNRIGEAYDDVSIDDIKRKNKYSQYNNFSDRKEVDGIGYLHFKVEDAGDWYMWGEVKAFDLSDGTEVANVSYGKPMKFSQLKASVDVRPDFRRMGIATEIYDWIEELTGEQLYPDTPHSKSAQEFWKSRNKDRRSIHEDREKIEVRLIDSSYHDIVHDMVYNEFSSYGTPFIGLFLNNEIIGAILVEDVNHWEWMFDIIIDKKYRSRGYAKILMDKFMDEFKKHKDVEQIRAYLSNEKFGYYLESKYGFGRQVTDGGDLVYFLRDWL